MYRIISNGVVFKVQTRICYIWFTLGRYKNVPEAEAQIKILLEEDKAKGKGQYMVYAVYDLNSTSDWHDSPTNAERLLQRK